MKPPIKYQFRFKSRKPKILLVIPNFHWVDDDLNALWDLIPWNLCLLAAMVEDFCEVKILDSFQKNQTTAQFKKSIRDSYNNGKVDIQWWPLESLMYLFIKKSQNESTIIKTTNSINLSEIKWKKKEPLYKPTTPMFLRIKRNRKMILNEILYYYRRITE